MFTRTTIIGATLLALGLSGCTTLNSLKDQIPSGWDPNQSVSVTNIQQTTRRIDCSQNLGIQLSTLQSQIEWFQIYSETKGTKDVLKLASTLSDTTKELSDRASKGEVSAVYCNLKKKILVEQANIVADTVQGRF